MIESSLKIVMTPPPGEVLAFNGFPSDPFPKGAPRGFLDAMEVRVKVFCDEQHYPEDEELDEDDSRSWHWVAYLPNELGDPVPVSVIRIVPGPHGPHPNGNSDPHEEAYFKIGRVATIASARGKGLCRRLTEEVSNWFTTHKAALPQEWKGLLLAHAQASVEKMYTKLGFVTDDRLGRWNEGAVEHLGMWKRIECDGDKDP